MYKLIDSNYNQIFKISDMEWCEFVSKKSLRGPISKIVTSALKDCCPQLYRKCPHKGLYELQVTFGNIMGILPTGTYRLDVHIYDDLDNNLAALAPVFEVYN